ncbi:MAG TPA: DnaA/Hda family protein [Sphingomicrobium sp.]|nr:DnaA/Hda family protein [Sphingomicrobium sp.]
MRPPADQIALPLDWPQAGDDSRFIISEANREAYEHFRAWSLWPVKASILTGPPRSGRSLLARAFVERVHGRLFDRAERHNEADIFHAWNAAQDDGRPLVMVVDQPPPQWEVALPDLRTRLAITPVVQVQQPDDALFRSLIRLLFADRGLHIAEDALTFISQRVERTYWMAERVVEAIDRFAIAERARLTLPTIRRALADGGILDARGAA